MTRNTDGIYRWTYELNMYRNPTVLITVLKVLGISMGLVWLFTVLISIGDRRFWWDGFLSETKVFALVMLGFIVRAHPVREDAIFLCFLDNLL